MESSYYNLGCASMMTRMTAMSENTSKSLLQLEFQSPTVTWIPLLLVEWEACAELWCLVILWSSWLSLLQGLTPHDVAAANCCAPVARSQEKVNLVLHEFGIVKAMATVVLL